jgi:hypothetical protein
MRYLRRVGKAVAVWIVSNYTWGLVSGAFGFVVAAVLSGLVGVGNPYLLVALALLVAAGTAAVAPRAWSAWRHELGVRIKSEHWDNFEHKARILEIEVEIVNRTTKPKRILAYGLRVDSGETRGIDVEVWREVERRKQTHQRLEAISVIEPKDSAHGWLVYGLPLAPEIKGPIPYRLTVRDELNLDYEASP